MSFAGLGSAQRQPARHRKVHQRTRVSICYDIVVARLAANDAAERDRAFVRPARALGGVERNRDGRRQFERARNADALEGRARVLQRARGAGEQGVGDILIEARLGDEDARALEIA